MKATILALVVLMSSVSMNVMASNSTPDDVNVGIESISKRSLAKEYVIQSEDSVATDTKIIYTENNEGNRTAKIVYNLDKETGNWIVLSRTSYKYNKNNELTHIVNAYWDKALAKWTNVRVQNVL